MSDTAAECMIFFKHFHSLEANGSGVIQCITSVDVEQFARNAQNHELYVTGSAKW